MLVSGVNLFGRFNRISVRSHLFRQFDYVGVRNYLFRYFEHIGIVRHSLDGSTVLVLGIAYSNDLSMLVYEASS